MDLLQATDEKHLIIEDQVEREVDTVRPLLHAVRQHDFWAKRYLCIHGIHDRKFWRFKIFDLLTKDLKSMRFQKFSNQFRAVDTYFLNCKFMLIVEKNQSRTHSYRVNLVKFNWDSGVFETVEHFELKGFFSYVIVDPLNQSKFVLVAVPLFNLMREHFEFKLVNGKIKLGNVHRLSHDFYQCLGDKLIRVDDVEGRKIRVKTYNMIGKEVDFFETETIPEHVDFMYNLPRKWVVDRMYATIRFRDSGNYGLMWTDEKTRRWAILNFSTNISVQALHFFDGSLIVYTQQVGKENRIFKSSVKFYEIAIHRPQSLRQKAWSVVIRNLKLEGHFNPYGEANKYLPFNTDLRPYWFEDVEEGAADKQDEDSEKSDFGGEEVVLLKRRKPN